MESSNKYKNHLDQTDTFYGLQDKVTELIDYCKKNDFFVDDQYRLINGPQEMSIAISGTERVTITYK
jgi:hypothetical protein